MKKTRRNSITEYELLGFCNQYFRGQGFLTREEVPFLLKVADLFCFHEGSGECVAVEVKVRNWRQALTQALVYQMMADQVYIALYNEYTKSVDHNLLLSKGVGLLAIDASGKVDSILEAPASPRRVSYFVSTTVATAFPGRGSLACLMV